MKHSYPVYSSEAGAFQKITGSNRIICENLDGPCYHNGRVLKCFSLSGDGPVIIKKYRSATKRSVDRAYREAAAHLNLSEIGVSVPYLLGMIRSDEECSLLIQYVNSYPLTHFLGVHKEEHDLLNYLISVGKELGKMFNQRFLHGDLTSYHVLIDPEGRPFLIDLERTRQYKPCEFYDRLPAEWRGFVDATRGRRATPLDRKHEESLLLGVLETLQHKKTREIIKGIVSRGNR